MTRGKRIYVLDTNVLMHDPTSLFRFEEHDVFIPMTVLEELDNAKKGMSEVSRNARQVSRFLNELVQVNKKGSISEGLRLDRGKRVGKLYFQTETIATVAQTKSIGGLPDNLILSAVLALRQQRPKEAVVLVTKDINLRIKASIAGVPAEDYENDRALDDFSLLYTGMGELPANFWDLHPELRSWTERGRTFYEVKCRKGETWHPNQCLYLPGEDEVEMRVIDIANGRAKLQILDDHVNGAHSVWGVHARNREQNFALNVLMDPDVDFVTLLGTAGTGKTLLALAAGLAQTMDQQRYREIIMTRATRGRTFLQRYVIIDEAQNMTSKQMKTLVTRAGPGCKIVCLGNVEQIDTPYLTETTSGLTYVVDRFKDWQHSAHVTLRRGERSRLADFASEML